MAVFSPLFLFILFFDRFWVFLILAVLLGFELADQSKGKSNNTREGWSPFRALEDICVSLQHLWH